MSTEQVIDDVDQALSYHLFLTEGPGDFRVACDEAIPEDTGNGYFHPDGRQVVTDGEGLAVCRRCREVCGGVRSPSIFPYKQGAR